MKYRDQVFVESDRSFNLKSPSLSTPGSFSLGCSDRPSLTFRLPGRATLGGKDASRRKETFTPTAAAMEVPHYNYFQGYLLLLEKGSTTSNSKGQLPKFASICNNTLAVFKSANESQPIRTISLNNSSVKASSEHVDRFILTASKREYAFQSISSQQIYGLPSFQPSTAEWLSAFAESERIHVQRARITANAPYLLQCDSFSSFFLSLFVSCTHFFPFRPSYSADMLIKGFMQHREDKSWKKYFVTVQKGRMLWYIT